MNLFQKGLRCILKSDTDLESELVESNVEKGYFSKSKGICKLPSGTYSVDVKLGEGVYGAAYQVVHATENTISVVKVIDLERRISSYGTYTEGLYIALKECLIHILLDETSRGEKEGPFVPQVHELAYDATRKCVLMRMERMHGSLDERYSAPTSAKENDTLIPQTLSQLAYIFEFFHKTLRMNHRDCKPDNVLYTIQSDGSLRVKLADFGSACITWNGLRITSHAYFSENSTCYIPSRDLTQYIYAIVISRQYQLSASLRKILQEILTFPADNQLCTMMQGCSAYGTSFHDWLGVYDFLKNPYINNPHTHPAKLQLYMKRLMQKADPTYTSISQTGHCLPDRIRNPKTGKCIRRDGKTGSKLIAKSEFLPPVSHMPKVRKTRKLKSKKTTSLV
jgi:serine/threonine protein kinase